MMQDMIRFWLESNGVENPSQEAVSIVAWLQDRIPYTTDLKKVIYTTYLWVDSQLKLGNKSKWKDRLDFISTGKHDRGLNFHLESHYKIKINIQETDGYTVIEDKLLKIIELEYILGVMQTNGFTTNTLIQLIIKLGFKSPYENVRDAFSIIEQSINIYNIVWMEIMMPNILKAVTHFGHKITFDAGSKYTSNYDNLTITSFDTARLGYITKAMKQMLPSNTNKYIAKQQMIGKGKEEYVQSIMFMHTFITLFELLSGYPRVVANCNQKALKLLLEMGFNNGTDSKDFKDRLGRLSLKIDREILQTRRKKYPYITRAILSDEEVLKRSEFELLEINQDIKNGSFRRLVNRV